jgi:predicted small secreted protein
MTKSSRLAKLLLAFGVASIALGTSACNTVKGVGRDIQSVGQAGDDAIHGN